MTQQIAHLILFLYYNIRKENKNFPSKFSTSDQCTKLILFYNMHALITIY